MEEIKELISEINNGKYDNALEDIYVDKKNIEYQKKRYVEALNQYREIFGEDIISIFSAPGRSEIGGNHTDHQGGEVIATAIHLDAIAVVSQTEDNTVTVVSKGHGTTEFTLTALEKKDEECGQTISLIKGVIRGIQNRGYKVGGFRAYVTSDVLSGSGLSSSAAFEILIGAILNGLYNDMKITPVELAMIGQYAENEYFGKPCGLMDQMACSVGNIIHINFADAENPEIEKAEVDFGEFGYRICITDTKGSHADLTDEYAAVPSEMRQVAHFFGKELLKDVSEEEVLLNIKEIREKTSDRAVLRAIHYLEENVRVKKEITALKNSDMEEFLKVYKASGDSSYKYLQNVYTSKDVMHQNMSIALAVSEVTLKENGISRVHGGGFAGTIQAFVKNEFVNEYKKQMEAVFGEESCLVLSVRKYGGIQVM